MFSLKVQRVVYLQLIKNDWGFPDCFIALRCPYRSVVGCWPPDIRMMVWYKWFTVDKTLVTVTTGNRNILQINLWLARTIMYVQMNRQYRRVLLNMTSLANGQINTKIINIGNIEAQWQIVQQISSAILQLIDVPGSLRSLVASIGREQPRQGRPFIAHNTWAINCPISNWTSW